MSDLARQLLSKKEQYNALSNEFFQASQEFMKKNNQLKNIKISSAQYLEDYVRHMSDMAQLDSELVYQRELMKAKSSVLSEERCAHNDEVSNCRDELEIALNTYKECKKSVKQFQRKVEQISDRNRIDALNMTAFCNYAQALSLNEIKKNSNTKFWPSNKDVKDAKKILNKRVVASEKELLEFYHDKIADFRVHQRVLKGRQKEIFEQFGLKQITEKPAYDSDVALINVEQKVFQKKMQQRSDINNNSIFNHSNMNRDNENKYQMFPQIENRVKFEKNVNSKDSDNNERQQAKHKTKNINISPTTTTTTTSSILSNFRQHSVDASAAIVGNNTINNNHSNSNSNKTQSVDENFLSKKLAMLAPTPPASSKKFVSSTSTNISTNASANAFQRNHFYTSHTNVVNNSIFNNQLSKKFQNDNASITSNYSLLFNNISNNNNNNNKNEEDKNKDVVYNKIKKKLDAIFDTAQHNELQVFSTKKLNEYDLKLSQLALDVALLEKKFKQLSSIQEVFFFFFKYKKF
jgi:hypothetical protein